MRQYNTTVEAIRAVNYYLPSPLWVDWLVIIPVGITDTQGLPAFEAYMVTDQVTIEELAQKLSVSPEVLRYYNAVEGGYRLTPGEWLLIPKNSATP